VRFHLWEPSRNNWNIDAVLFIGQFASLKMYWEQTLYICQRLWEADVICISWNRYISSRELYINIMSTITSADFTNMDIVRLASCIVGSGCGGGSFSVHDLR